MAYRSQLLERKAEGAPIPEASEPAEGEVVDPMEALRQSVAATKTKRARKRPPARKAS
jgi:non-homologous end joining protein Ku